MIFAKIRLNNPCQDLGNCKKRITFVVHQLKYGQWNPFKPDVPYVNIRKKM